MVYLPSIYDSFFYLVHNFQQNPTISNAEQAKFNPWCPGLILVGYGHTFHILEQPARLDAP